MEDIVDMESELSKRLQEVMVVVIMMVVIIAMVIIVYFRLVEDLRRRPTVKWARSSARWRPHIQNDHLK